MKDKLVKTNMTKFDYRAKKLGFFGLVLVVLTFAITLPVASSLVDANNTLTREIVVLENKSNDSNTNYNMEK